MLGRQPALHSFCKKQKVCKTGSSVSGSLVRVMIKLILLLGSREAVHLCVSSCCSAFCLSSKPHKRLTSRRTVNRVLVRSTAVWSVLQGRRALPRSAGPSWLTILLTQSKLESTLIQDREASSIRHGTGYGELPFYAEGPTTVRKHTQPVLLGGASSCGARMNTNSNSLPDPATPKP